MTKSNIYMTGKNKEALRAVKIKEHWRIAAYEPKTDIWLFLNETEYTNPYQALGEYV